MIGSMALVLSFSVLGGYQETFKATISTFTSHIQIATLNRSRITTPEQLCSELRQKFPTITTATPVLQREVLIRKNNVVEGVMIKALQLDSGAHLARRTIVQGTAAFTSTLAFEVILSSRLLRKLSCSVGDSVFLITTQGELSLSAIPFVKKFKVIGSYESGMQQYDDAIMYAPYNLVETAFNEGTTQMIEVWIQDFDEATAVSRHMQDFLSFPYYTQTIMENPTAQSIFAWIDTQKVSIPLVLSLISVVAVFNILTTLLISVVEKSRSYAILATLGIQPRDLLFSVTMQGVVIGLVASLSGCLLALLFCWLQRSFGLIHLDGSVYFVDKLPVSFALWHYLVVMASSLLLSFLATLVPGWIVMRLSPLNALRFS